MRTVLLAVVAVFVVGCGSSSLSTNTGGGSTAGGGSATGGGAATGGGTASGGGGGTTSTDAGVVLPVGVNMPGLFWMYLGTAPEGPTQARAQMDSARALGITHARFVASGYWPVDM